MQTWTVIGAFENAWEKFLANAGVLMIMMLIGMFGGMCAGLPAGILDAAAKLAAERVAPGEADAIRLGATLIGLVFQLFNAVVQVYFTLGSVRVCLNIVRGQEASLRDLVVPPGTFLRGFAANALVGLGTVLGLLMCVVPGVVFMLGSVFAQYGVVDRELGPIQAIQESWRLTEGERLSVLGFFLACAGVVVAGVLACCVGLFAALPVISLATATVYDALLREKGAAPTS
jgi:uncharacterized membrane protein